MCLSCVDVLVWVCEVGWARGWVKVAVQQWFGDFPFERCLGFGLGACVLMWLGYVAVSYLCGCVGLGVLGRLGTWLGNGCALKMVGGFPL